MLTNSSFQLGVVPRACLLERKPEMGRGRAPCCEKVGLNKGSWTPEEDMRLIAYILKYGHGNWRALPKQAGLLRCGKSCRLRWINYLRPDIKRGNFTKEEEDTIIKLHGLLGNKWSKIASCLPGRTDNEIKNVWNTHLKKRLAPKGKSSPSPTSHNKPEEQPSSPSSTAASVSCSDQTDEARDHDIEKIEIPIEPNWDIWDMLDDSLNSEPSLEPIPSKVSPCSSSSDVGQKDDPLDEIPDIPIEPELWSMIDGDLEAAGATEEFASQLNPTTFEAASNGSGGESGRWLAYLEKELEEMGPSAEMDGGDPVSSYFQTRPSSPFPLDLLY